MQARYETPHTSSESSLEASSALVAPSYTDESNDLAIRTIPNRPLGSFTLIETRDWLMALAQRGNDQKISRHKPSMVSIYIDFTLYVQAMMKYIDREHERASRG
jgi:hypothetical protein